jgi:hypothetical protein
MNYEELIMAEPSRKTGESSERDQSDTRERSRLTAVADQTEQEVRGVAERGADVAKRTAETVADATRRTAEVAANTTRHAADQGREATVSGLRAIAGFEGPLADAGFEQSRRVVETTAHVTDVYREAAERTAGDVHALFDSWASLGRGLQHWQHAYFDHLQQWGESIARKPQNLIQSKSPVEFAEIQRDVYVDLVSITFRASTTLLQLAGKIAQDAVRPLQERAQARG